MNRRDDVFDAIHQHESITGYSPSRICISMASFIDLEAERITIIGGSPFVPTRWELAGMPMEIVDCGGECELIALCEA